jgi:hypothetical protein
LKDSASYGSQLQASWFAGKAFLSFLKLPFMEKKLKNEARKLSSRTRKLKTTRILQ